jgi:hypothetical protein
LQKFSLPEFEVQELDNTLSGQAEALLLSIAQTILIGRKFQLGDRVGAANMPFEIGPGGLDRAVWEGVDCFELLPPSGSDSSKAVSAWAAEAVGRTTR